MSDGFVTIGTIPVQKGDKGDKGNTGDPGPNTIPTNEAIDARLTPYTKTSGLPAIVVERLDNLRWQTNLLGTGGLVIAGPGDSLTDGASGSSFRQAFSKMCRAAMGDGGPGLHPFNNGVATSLGAGFTKSDSLAYLDLLNGGRALHFPSGLYTENGDGSGFFIWEPGSAWDTARVLYLKEPGGGSFKFKVNNELDAAAVTINTGTVNADGSGGAVTTATIGFFDYPNAAGGPAGVRGFAFTGVATIFAADFRLSRNPRGYRQGYLARGSATLQQFAASNMTSYQAWIAALAPAAMIPNLGMNDRGTRSAAQHEADLTTIIQAARAGAPDMPVLIVMSNEAQDYATTNQKDYAQAKKNVARTLDCAYYDERSVLGDYTRATAAGLMADGVHPNLKGNRRRAQGLAMALGIPVSMADQGPTYPQTEQRRYGTLTRKRGTFAAGNETKVIHRLGLVNGFPTGTFEFKVFTQRAGQNVGVVKRFTVILTNGINQANRASVVGAVTSQTVHSQTAGDNGTLDVTLAVVAVNGFAEIQLTSVGFGGTYDIQGEYTLTTAGLAGQAVYENAVS